MATGSVVFLRFSSFKKKNRTLFLGVFESSIPSIPRLDGSSSTALVARRANRLRPKQWMNLPVKTRLRVLIYVLIIRRSFKRIFHNGHLSSRFNFSSVVGFPLRDGPTTSADSPAQITNWTALRNAHYIKLNQHFYNAWSYFFSPKQGGPYEREERYVLFEQCANATDNARGGLHQSAPGRYN